MDDKIETTFEETATVKIFAYFESDPINEVATAVEVNSCGEITLQSDNPFTQSLIVKNLHHSLILNSHYIFQFTFTVN